MPSSPSPSRYGRCSRCASSSRPRPGASPPSVPALRFSFSFARATRRCSCSRSFPLRCALPWRTRIASAAAFAVAAVSLLGLWTVHNGVRFGDYTVARGGNSRLPFERAFIFDRIVRPDNGPASRRLARAVETQLLPEEPYRSYGIHLDDFFSEPSPRMKDDLGALANQLDGWQSDERLLRKAGIEAVRTHPGTYARGVTRTVWRLLRWPILRPEPSTESDTTEETAPGAGGTIVVDGRRLPRPSEGQRIPASHFAGPTSPDGSIYAVWTSPNDYHLVFVHAGDEERYDALHRRIDELAAGMPDRVGSASGVRYLNLASRGFPSARCLPRARGRRPGRQETRRTRLLFAPPRSPLPSSSC